MGAAPAFAAGVTEKYDVVVVGSGSAGFAAAIRAAEAGSSVILLEVNTWFGGASRVATGIFGCAGHPIQKALGFKTTPEDLYQLYIGEAAATHTVGEPDVAGFSRTARFRLRTGLSHSVSAGPGRRLRSSSSILRKASVSVRC